MTAHFRLATKPRDFENLVMSLKYVRDALKQRQPEDDPLRWREGLYVDKGFFVDDDPSRCELADVTQETGAEEPGLRVTIEPIEEG